MFKLTAYSALLLLVLVTGLFWGTWFAMTRSIYDFSAYEFIHIGNVIIANVAWPMRIIMPFCLVLLLFAWWWYPQKGLGSFLALGAFVLMLTSLLITLLVEVPIDNQIKTWTTKNLPANWENLRATWDQWHTARTFTSLAACLLFTGALFRLIRLNN
ncbi:MAG TPA: DUF1772 domain-containing protein [Flavobacteriales bacterium]|nr:DUF1772 domain-containing protein [Flavobacteriales bacterium]